MSTEGRPAQEDQAARNSLSRERVAYVPRITATHLNDKAANLGGLVVQFRLSRLAWVASRCR
jgi:hypothetical protein